MSRLQLDDGNLDGAVTAAREAVTRTRRLAESNWPAHHPHIARRLRTLGRALRERGEHAAAVACYEESESILENAEEGVEAEPRAASLAITRFGLAITLGAAARDHLAGDRPAEAVGALRSLLALTRRTDRSDVHARCVTAFDAAHAAHGETVVPAWRQATGADFPTFVYRLPAADARTSTADE